MDQDILILKYIDKLQIVLESIWNEPKFKFEFIAYCTLGIFTGNGCSFYI